MRRGDLDTMRLRKDELRKQLDCDFLTLTGRVGRLRQEPIGFDRDRREYMLLGGPFEGQQPLADLSRLLVRRRAARADEPEGMGKLEWEMGVGEGGVGDGGLVAVEVGELLVRGGRRDPDHVGGGRGSA